MERSRLLVPTELRSAESAVTGDGSLVDLLRRVARAPPQTPGGTAAVTVMQPGVEIGRFRIEGQLGAGGMGIVYRAQHLDLDRPVALKIHLIGQTKDAQARLLREAQAMAQLSHPNVVEIHDLGTIDGQVFIAMEFIDGGSARAWLRERERSWREVLDVFKQAGRGLIAAHAADLIHRDFKPDNVLVSRDGRAKVADFGLVAAARDPVTDPDGMGSSEMYGTLEFSDRLTLTGSVVGTPAYMAPEQYDGRADERSDQFSFCVALFEGIYSVRPYAGQIAPELVANMASGQIVAPSGRILAPSWLRRVIERGLSPEPADRFPSMQALLDALEHGGRSQRRFAWIGGGAVAAALAAVLWPTAERCDELPDRFTDVWDQDRKSSLAGIFGGSKDPGAKAAWDSVSEKVDTFASDWVALDVELCRADAEGTGDAADHDLQRSCLENQFRRVRAVLEVIEPGDAKVVTNVVNLGNGIPSVLSCRDLAALREEEPPPDDPKTAAAVQEIDELLAKGVALQNAAKFSEGRQAVEQALARARAAQYAPSLAEALYQLGDVMLRQGEHEPAGETLKEAFTAAAEARRNGEMGDAATALAHVYGHNLAQPEEGLKWWREAEAAYARAGATPDRRIRLAMTAGMLKEDLRRYSESEDHYRHALTLVDSIKEAGKRTRARGDVLVALARAVDGQGRKTEAIELYKRAISLLERGTSRDHPSVASAINNLATSLYDVERFEEAIGYYERAIEICERAFGPQSNYVGIFLGNLANAHTALGRHDEAAEVMGRAITILEAAYGTEHQEVAFATSNLARIERSRGNLDDALRLFLQALPTLEGALGHDHPDVGALLISISGTRRDAGDAQAALRDARRAVSVLEPGYGKDHPETARAYLAVGLAALEDGATKESRVALEHALGIGFGEASARQVSDARFGLARFFAANSERTKAIASAREALAVLEDNAGNVERRVKIEAWLADMG